MFDREVSSGGYDHRHQGNAGGQRIDLDQRGRCHAMPACQGEQEKLSHPTEGVMALQLIVWDASGRPICIFLNRSPGWPQEGVEPLSYDGVALTRCLFEAGSVENLNFSPTIVDKAGLLHRLRCKRHRFAIGTQHVRQELVRVWQLCAIGPIKHHKEPSAYSLFRCMQGIARDRLLNLRQQRLRIADEEIAHVFTAFEFRLQQLDRTANYATLQLPKASIKGDATVHGRKEAECSFAPDVCGLNCRAVLQNG